MTVKASTTYKTNDTLRQLWRLAEDVDAIWVTPEHFALIDESARGGHTVIDLHLRDKRIVAIKQIQIFDARGNLVQPTRRRA